MCDCQREKIELNLAVERGLETLRRIEAVRIAEALPRTALPPEADEAD
jgi:hypothetical protein